MIKRMRLLFMLLMGILPIVISCKLGEERTLATPLQFRVVSPDNVNQIQLQWLRNPEHKDGFLLYRTGPYNKELTVATLSTQPVTAWHYLSKVDQKWKPCTAHTKYDDCFVITESRFKDLLPLDFDQFYYYQLVAVDRGPIITNLSTIQEMSRPAFVKAFAKGPYVPAAVVGITVSKAEFTDVIRVSWKPMEKVTSYNIYRLTKEEFEKKKTFANEKPIATVKAEQYLDKTAEAKVDYVYRVQALWKEEGKETVPGLLPKTFDLNIATGNLLTPPENFTLSQATGKIRFRLDWDANANRDLGYIIYRSNKFNTEQTEADLLKLPVSEWNYLPSIGLEWEPMTDLTRLTDNMIFSSNAFVDIDPIEKQKYYYYKLVMVNKKVIDDPVLNRLGNIEASPLIGEAFIPLDLTGWLTATNGDLPTTTNDPLWGKVGLKVNVPFDQKNDFDKYDIVIERTYRYGGGYQGHLATRADKSSHTNLKNPNPTTVPWEKTIELEYKIDNETLKSEPIIVYDTMYDVDVDGNKLLAALDTTTPQPNEGLDKGTNYPHYPWYERTQNFIDQDGGMKNWRKMVDPDGKDSEMEFHYLIWDWMIRKAMYHPDNPKQFENRFARVDLNEMLSAEYRIVLKEKNAPLSPNGEIKVKKYYGPVVKGRPTLTPREFVFLSLLLKDVSFYRLPLTYKDEYVELDLVNADNAMAKANNTVKGAISGEIRKENSNLPFLSKIVTFRLLTFPKEGIEEFPNVKLIFNINPYEINTKRDYWGTPILTPNSSTISLTSPVANGSIEFQGEMHLGSYFHGVGPNTIMKIHYGIFDGVLNERMQKQAWPTISMEYLNDGFRVHRASDKGVNATNYFDRYTSINWSYPVKGVNPTPAYPGFR